MKLPLKPNIAKITLKINIDIEPRQGSLTGSRPSPIELHNYPKSAQSGKFAITIPQFLNSPGF